MSCLAACIGPNTLVNFELSVRRLFRFLYFGMVVFLNTILTSGVFLTCNVSICDVFGGLIATLDIIESKTTNC